MSTDIQGPIRLLRLSLTSYELARRQDGAEFDNMLIALRLMRAAPLLGACGSGLNRVSAQGILSQVRSARWPMAATPFHGNETECRWVRSSSIARTGLWIVASRADEYRRRAEQCLDMAGTFKDRESRVTLAHMAQVWLRLADDFDDADEGLRLRGEKRPADVIAGLGATSDR